MSALQKQPITIPLLGLDTHSDPKNAPAGSFDLLENVFGRRLSGSGVEWRKRFGTTSRTRNILGGGTISNARKLARFGDEQLVVTDTHLYSWGSIAGAWIDKGPLTPAGLSTVRVASSINSSLRTATDIAVGGGYVCAISRVGAVARATVINLATGVAVLDDVELGLGATASGAHVVALASTFMIVGMNNSGSTLLAVKINYATPATVSAPTTIATDASTIAPRWDVARAGSADQVMVAYNGDAVPRMRGVLWNSNMSSAGAWVTGEQPDASMGWLCHDYADGKAYLAYVSSASGTKVITIDIATWTTVSAATLDGARTTGRNVTGYRSGGANTVTVEVAGAQTYLNKLVRSTGGAFADWQLGCGLRSRVFKVASTYYLTAAYADGLQDKYFVLRADDATVPPQIIATAHDGNGSGLTVLDSTLPAVPAISSTVVAVPVEIFEVTLGAPGGGGADVYGSAYLKLDFAPTLSSPKRIGEELLLPGAIVRAYDGNTTTELGFPVFPVCFNPTQAAGAGFIAAGTYSFVAVTAFVDGRGQVHRSSPSAPIKVVVAAGSSIVTVDVTNLRLGDKGIKANLDLYVTQDGGTTYNAVSGYASGTGNSVTFTINAIVGNVGAELYTTGRALPHNAFPPANLIEVWRDRAFFAETDVPNELWCSDEAEAGSGLSASQANVLPLPSDDGDVTALAEFDDRVVIGKASALYQLSGSGPAANGDGQFQQPARVNTTEGPTSQLGVIKTNAGLIFKSSHGYYLLPRGGADPVMLDKVEGYESLTLAGASNVDSYEQTRLVTAEGRTLVYHYGLPDEKGLGRWSTFTGQAAVDCANFAGAWCYLASDGTVRVEDQATWADDGVAFTRKERLTWITGGGILNNLRIYNTAFLGDVIANCTITGTLAYDYDSTVVNTLSLAVTPSTKGVLKMAGSRGRMSAIQLALSETGTTEGYRLTEIGIEIGAKPGFAKAATGAFLT